MNDKSTKIFEEDGGRALIGKNVFDCHPEPALTELKRLVETRRSNVYTIEKNGLKKLIYHPRGTKTAHMPVSSNCRWKSRSSCRTLCAAD